MFHKALKIWIVLAVGTSIAVASETTQQLAKLSAAEIATRNIAARGGLQAWRAIQDMKMSGKMEAGGNNRTTLQMPGRKDSRYMPPPRPAEQVRLPFVMELKRPMKIRVEVDFNGQTAIQVFDGIGGWKLRPFLNRRQVEPYTDEELKTVATQSELDGPLVDYVTKGTSIELAGIEKVEGHDTYKLKLTMKNGKTTNLWIDAGTFLEAKSEGSPRRVDGKDRPVEIYYRDYRSVDGLKIPFLLETKVLNPKATPGSMSLTTATEQIVIEKVQVNLRLNDVRFSKEDLDAVVSPKSSTAPAALQLTR